MKVQEAYRIALVALCLLTIFGIRNLINWQCIKGDAIEGQPQEYPYFATFLFEILKLNCVLPALLTW